MATVSNLLFDIGNVILDLDIDGTVERIGAFRQDTYSDAQFLEMITPPVLAFETGSSNPDTFLAEIRAHLKEGLTDQQIIEEWNSMLLTIPAYRLGMLTALRTNFTVLALSNTNALHLARLHEYLASSHGVTEFETTYFDDVYYSHLIGARKPDKEAFEHVIDDAFITPAKTLFIDDHADNIATAESMGFQVMLSPPDHEIAETLKLLGYY